MKLFMKNRKGQKVCVVVEDVSPSKGLAFIMHGLSGSKDQSHIQAFQQAFQEESFTTVLFDTTNTFGESDGTYEDATLTNYYEDLEDVISWAKQQEWYQEPFYLCGHSLGGMSIILFAEKYPAFVKGLAPISTTLSGKLSLASPRYQGNDILQQWKQTGWRVEERLSKPGEIKRLKWSHMEDRMKYDVLPRAKKLTMPVLMIVGDKDNGTPPDHQKILFNHLPGEKEIHIIKGAPHTFVDPQHIKEIQRLIRTWIQKHNKKEN